MNVGKDNNQGSISGDCFKAKKPQLTLNKIGIVARDYMIASGNSDFSTDIITILKKLDDEGCDGVLFSLYTILKDNNDILQRLNNLKFNNLKGVFIEEFEWSQEGKSKTPEFKNQIIKIYHLEKNEWQVCCVKQLFGSLKDINEEGRRAFVKNLSTERSFGNISLIICGETNIAKYSSKQTNINDIYNVLNAIPDSTKLILNPIHDKMTRHEMKKKRCYLSSKGRFVISVWNKGKVNKDGKTRDGDNPPWTVFYNGQELGVSSIDISGINDKTIEVGILDTKLNLNYAIEFKFHI